MRDFGKMPGGSRADFPAGRIVSDQVRKGGLDRCVAPHQRVIIGIRNLGRVLGVIKPVMERDLGGETLEFGGGLGVGGGQRIRHAALFRVCFSKAETVAVPARSPTRPPNQGILWEVGWGSGPVPIQQS